MRSFERKPPFFSAKVTSERLMELIAERDYLLLRSNDYNMWKEMLDGNVLE